MAKRRGNQDGTFYKRGDRWCGQIMIDNVRYTVYGKGIQECREKLRQKVKEGKKRGADTDFIEYCLAFIKQQLDSKQIKNTTYDGKRQAIIKYRGFFTGITVSSLKKDDLIRLVVDLKNDQKKASSIKTLLSVFLSVCTHAYKNKDMQDLITMSDLNLDKPEIKKLSLIPYDEAKDRISKVKNIQYRIFFGIILHSGLRVGEARAFSWKNMELDTGIYYVKENLVYINGIGEVLTTPKNNVVGQPVQLPLSFVEELKEYKKICNSEYLFKNTKGTFIGYNALSRNYKKIFKGTALDGGVHKLRHLYASYLLSQDIDLKTIQLQLRHHSTNTTDKYLHDISSNQRESILNLNF